MKSTFLLRVIIICVSVLVIFSMIANTPANAASGLPNSPQFGYGARIDARGQKVDVAINAATGIGLDWIGLDFDWARQWPDKNQSPSLEPLNQVIHLAGQNRLHVLISITNPPDWAMGPNGPDASLTSKLVSLLAQQFADTLLRGLSGLCFLGGLSFGLGLAYTFDLEPGPALFLLLRPFFRLDACLLSSLLPCFCTGLSLFLLLALFCLSIIDAGDIGVERPVFFSADRTGGYKFIVSFIRRVFCLARP